MEEIFIEAARPSDGTAIPALLTLSNLPTAGLLECLANAVVARQGPPSSAVRRSRSIETRPSALCCGSRRTQRLFAARRSAQHLVIRSLTAFLAAADIVPRRWLAGALPPRWSDEVPRRRKSGNILTRSPISAWISCMRA